MIELPSFVKKCSMKMLLNLGAPGNSISDAMATTLRLQV